MAGSLDPVHTSTSLKFENLQAAVSLHFAHYNNLRIHSSLRVAPALAANLNDRLWSLEELVESTSYRRLKMINPEDFLFCSEFLRHRKDD